MATAGQVLREALQQNLLNDEDSFCVFYDLEHFRQCVRNIMKAFPSSFLHTIACKANPLKSMLKIAAEMGMGCEVASLPELVHALRIFSPSKIVFDSPAKTKAEIRFAIQNNVLLNADNLQEIDVIASVLNEMHVQDARVGLRINPQTGAGQILSTSTATSSSKFGYGIEHRNEIIDAFAMYSWLKGVHVHTGSQGCNLAHLSTSVRVVIDLVLQINEARFQEGHPPIQFCDIGGGLPIDYSHQSSMKEGDQQEHALQPTDYTEYAHLLKHSVPELWGIPSHNNNNNNNDKDTTNITTTTNTSLKKVQFITEFGRSVSASSAIAISRVEYTKVSGGTQIATIHSGADFLLRNAYMPNDWKHVVDVFNSSGVRKPENNLLNNQKSSSPLPLIIAGPLCFSGDVLSTFPYIGSHTESASSPSSSSSSITPSSSSSSSSSRNSVGFPVVNRGDYIVIYDVGSYSLSMWSRYNSRQAPAVYGFETHSVHGKQPQMAGNAENTKLFFQLLKPKETVEQVLNFWG